MKVFSRSLTFIACRKHPHKPHVDGLDHYKEMYKESIENPSKFWGKLARELLTWDKDFQTVCSGSLTNGDNAWFIEGYLNAAYNCVDRHAFKNPNKPAIIYEADEPGEGRTITYSELLREVCKLTYVLKEMGLKKGDTVALYLPMIPEALIAFLACTRIGAIHSVVFAGFSSDSLRDRIIDAKSKIIITTDEGKRGGKIIGTKKIVDEALKQCPAVTHCLVYKRTGSDVPWTKGRDFWWHEEVEKWPNYIPPQSMNAEDPLFLLYTSGSTGKPKGVMHTTGGYLVGAAATGKYVFDIHDNDIFFCGGDVGWITGHTYVVYAPLLLGVATVVFEGTPAYPNFSRYWDVVEKHNVTQFYVAPTALRLLKRAGDQHVKNQMKNLRILGSVGEPIAAEVWKWYFEIVGKSESHVVDVSFLSTMLISGCSLTFHRPTGRPKQALMSLLLLVASHPPSPVLRHCHSLASNQPSSTPYLVRRFTAMMSRVYLPSRSHGQAWLEPSGVLTNDIWTHT
jgi:acetyl-CoA synthetase